MGVVKAVEYRRGWRTKGILIPDVAVGEGLGVGHGGRGGGLACPDAAGKEGGEKMGGTEERWGCDRCIQHGYQRKRGSKDMVFIMLYYT